ncbi:uncharacterized protein LOC112683629 [Sipha flava]|uniref:Uncharacterized protein LOC112683629 n=1 Tax=Sipha flava TaxID=143950 RepID=A0A8B8FIJ6_9HEMI|nr:uncharacterized protein LOC112683629 [Sipha flava]
MRKLQNGEKKIRDWIVYSPSKNALFCYQCLLFSPKPTVFGNKDEGFISWKKCNEILHEHETSKNHAESVKIWFSRIKKDCSVIDIELKKDIENQTSYWKNVLHRIVETISFLASRGLAFRGDNQTFGSKQNGNYLGYLELLAKFDPFLSAHIAKYGNKGKGNVSYLSSTICDEFIMLMMDSNPDITTHDQLTIAVRYITKEDKPVERFLGFMSSVGHKGTDMELIKKMCTTRWSSRYDVCKAIFNGYEQVLSALKTIRDDERQKKETRHEASSIYNKIKSLNFCFMICMWTPILQRFNATSVTLQSIDIDLVTVVTLYKSLETYLEDIRNKFDFFLEQAKIMSSEKCFSWEISRKKKRKRFFDENETADEKVLESCQKMKCGVFLVIIDRLM